MQRKRGDTLVYITAVPCYMGDGDLVQKTVETKLNDSRFNVTPIICLNRTAFKVSW